MPIAGIVKLGPTYFPLTSSGRPISNGYIYVGTVDLDPEIPGNQIPLTILEEDGSETVVAQPIRTNAGGVPTYSGSPVTLIVTGNYSLKINNSLGAQIYYVANSIVPVVVTPAVDGLMSAADKVLWNAHHGVGGTVNHPLATAAVPGFMSTADFLLTSRFPQRSKFIWSTVTTILLDPATYYHDGTINQLLYWASQLTFVLGPGGSNASSTALGNNQDHYVYIDDSEVSGQIIDETMLLNSTTAPSWSDTRQGWYNGEDKCIFAVRTNGSAEILVFWHDKDYVLYDEDFVDYSAGTPSNVFTDVTLTVPAFVRQAEVVMRAVYVDATGVLFWRPNGSSNASPHNIVQPSAANQSHYNAITVLTDLALKIELAFSGVTTNTAYVYTEGWYFPIGM